MAGKRAVITRVLAVLAAFFVASCATIEKAEPTRANCTSNKDCVVKISVVACAGFWCRATVNVDELHLNGFEPSWELDEKARADGFTLDKDYGIWFKSIVPGHDFDCKPDAQAAHCKPKEAFTGKKRYAYGIQLRGRNAAVLLLDPWVVN